MTPLPRCFMEGYRAEHWTDSERDKNLILPLAPDFKFNVKVRPLPDKYTMVATSLPVCLEGASCPRPDHKDQLSVVAGAFKRLGAQVPQVSGRKLRQIRRFARRFIFNKFRPLTEADIKNPIEWIAGINHPEKRKAELVEAFHRMETNGFYGDVGDEQWKSVRAVSSFIKDECYPSKKAPRWINSSADEVKVYFGPIADAIMHRMTEHPAFIKVVPVAERAKAISEALYTEAGVYHAADYTSFECHFTDQIQLIAHDFYMYMLGNLILPDSVKNDVARRCLHEGLVNPAHFDSFLEQVLRSRRVCEMRNFGYVSMIARRMSGEMDTSLANTFTNFVMVHFMSYYKSGGKILPVETFVEGDDSITRYAQGIDPTEKDYADFGWVIKMERHLKLHEASFCGLVFDPVERVVLPNIPETLAKFGWTNRRYARSERKALMSLMRSKALSLACEYNNVPILGPFAQRILYLTKHVNIRKSVINSMEKYKRDQFLLYLQEKPWMMAPKIGPRTRELVESLFSITIQDQILIEEKLSKLEFGFFSIDRMVFPPELCDHFNRFIRLDQDGPPEYLEHRRVELVRKLQNKLYSDIQWPDKMISNLDKLLEGTRCSKLPFLINRSDHYI